MNKPAESGLRLALQSLPLEINGRIVDVPASCASQRLSDVVREIAGLTGTKVGCSAGDCGACTVLVDDHQVCACLIAAGQCLGKHIRTVESLAGPHGELSRLQQAFVDHGAAQCGICTPGMLMAAADTLRRHPLPTEEQVLDGLAGVLCRCTGYRKIVEAVLAAAPGRTVPSHAPSPGLAIAAVRTASAVGARVERFDAHAKVCGLERFGADEAPAEALWIRALRAPFPCARYSLGDLAAWIAEHPGVHGVLTAADIPRNRFAIFPDLRDQPALAEGEVRFAGEAVLAVVGTQAALARLDLSSLPIQWEQLQAISGIDAALAPGASAVHARWPDNILCRGRVVSGDLAQAERGAAHRLELCMRTQHVEHAYIEPEAGWASWEVHEGRPRVTLFACTQTPYMDRDEIAYMFDLDPECVRVIPSAVGGGFGGKLDLSLQPLLVAAARRFRRPARMVYDRPESMLSTTKRHPAAMRATLTADAAGFLRSYDFAGDFNTGAYASWGPTVANRVPIHAAGPYRWQAVRALTRAVITNDPIAGAFRGFGVPQATLIGESLIDAYAARIGADPLEVRYDNALRAGDRTATGQLLKASVGLRACLDALRPAWQRSRASLASWRAQHRSGERAPEAARWSHTDPHGSDPSMLRRGIGIACMWYGIGNTAMANPSEMEIGLKPDGRFVLFNGAVDIGQGSGTIMAQIAADALGVPLALMDQTSADTSLTLDAGKSSASRQTFVSGNAAQGAAADLRARLLELLGVAEPATLHPPAIPREPPTPCEPPTPHKPPALHLAGTTLSCGTAQLALHTLPLDARGLVAVGRARFNPPTVALDADGQGVPYATYGFAAQFAEVEVDLALGTVRVLAIHAAHDVGCAVNPTQVEGQIHGGIAQGLGLALMEDYVAQRTDNLHDYLIPTVGDIPPITVHVIEDREPLGPSGAKGVGEPALIATAPAILNAISHATGIRITEVPVTPDRLRAALAAHPEGSA